MPKCKPWNHTIDLKPDFMPKKGRVIPFFDPEMEEVWNFIDRELKKGYIQPSKFL